MFEPSNLFLNKYMTCNTNLLYMQNLIMFFQIKFQTAKPSTNITDIYTANFLLHVDILSASLGFKICKHVCTCCKLKEDEAENEFLASCQYPRCFYRIQ